jgi:hypothetical protein
VYQCIHYLSGLSADRKDSSPTLGHGRNPQFFEESHQLSGKEPGKRLAKELAIGPETGDEVG